MLKVARRFKAVCSKRLAPCTRGGSTLCSQASPPTADISAFSSFMSLGFQAGKVTRPFTFVTVMQFPALCSDLTSHLLLLKHCHPLGSGFYYLDCLNNIGSDLLLKLMPSFNVAPALGSREGCQMPAVGVD